MSQKYFWGYEIVVNSKYIILNYILFCAANNCN